LFHFLFFCLEIASEFFVQAIPAGTAVESSAYGHGELLLPIYGSDLIYEEHPPLREYIWDEDNLPETAVEYPFEPTALFVPGLAAIAPCTSENNNLKLGEQRGWSASSDDGGVHRSTHPQAGAFSYRHNVTYIAVRDIAPGEELTVNCDDDSFNGGAYYLTQYESFMNDDRVTCLDGNLRVSIATKMKAVAAASAEENNESNKNNQKDDPMGLGLFAKRDLAKDKAIISSPLTPIHREVFEITNDEDVNDKQLMLNYVFGHPDSDLLLLPIGPMVNFFNHRRKSDGGANAEIRWHHLKHESESNDKNQDDLRGYHDTSLFDLPGEVVAVTHGRGLVMDIVALRDISEGEEVYLDYGEEWQASWDKHVASFEKLQKNLSKEDREYVSAVNHNKLTKMEFEKEFEKTKDALDMPLSYYYRTEIEEKLEPYPENMEFFCFYHLPDENDKGEGEDKPNVMASALLRTTKEEGAEPKRFSWYDHSQHDCFRPCSLVERYPYEPPENTDGSELLSGDDLDSETAEPFYTVELYIADNHRVQDHCVISANFAMEDVPQSEIRLLDKPFTTDVLSPFAFRHEIGVPEGFYPESWMATKKRLRKVRGAIIEADESPESYKKTKQSSREKADS
jgi:hypothetical protein